MAPKQDDAADTPSDGPHLLFINSTGSARGRPRDAKTKRQIRQHVMRDIGKARRKPPRNPQVKLRVRSKGAEEAAAATDIARSAVSRESAASTLSPSSTPVRSSTLHRLGDTQAPSQPPLQLRSQSQDDTCGTPVHPLPPLTRPFWDQHPLAILEHTWAMDAFAAYGLALAVAWNSSLRGKHLVYHTTIRQRCQGCTHIDVSNFQQTRANPASGSLSPSKPPTSAAATSPAPRSAPPFTPSPRRRASSSP